MSGRPGDSGSAELDQWVTATLRLWGDWVTSWSQAAGNAVTGDEGNADFMKLLGSALPETAGMDPRRLTELGTTGAAAMTAMLAWQAALARPFADATSAFAAELGRRAGAGEVMPDLRDVMGTWNRILEQHLQTAMQGDDYTTAQSHLLRTVMRHRLAQREALEPVLEHFDMPTRSELDEAYKTIHELRRQVRELRHRLEAVEDALPENPSRSAETDDG